MAPHKTLYVAVVAGQKARNQKWHRRGFCGESTESPPEANCGQHAPGCSVSRISGKIRSFEWACSELKKFYVDGKIWVR